MYAKLRFSVPGESSPTGQRSYCGVSFCLDTYKEKVLVYDRRKTYSEWQSAYGLVTPMFAYIGYKYYTRQWNQIHSDNVKEVAAPVYSDEKILYEPEQMANEKIVWNGEATSLRETLLEVVRDEYNVPEAVLPSSLGYVPSQPMTSGSPEEDSEWISQKADARQIVSRITVADKTRTSARRADFTPMALSSMKLPSSTHEGLSS
ncbi:hypothetical protein GQ53DRAFT_868283 [Thozetella sp. PMI_491]|nr:hypothetical protein GQ53DRAFT_868283 [Thozetella sp. PMI_491]